MKEPGFIWVHLHHACDEIDVWRVTQPEEARIAKGQGYIPLTTLRQLEAELTAQLERNIEKENVVIRELLAENEALENAGSLLNALLRQAYLFKGYGNGPLQEPAVPKSLRGWDDLLKERE